MVDVVSSNVIFADFETPSMSILYKNARNVRFVLFRKNLKGSYLLLQMTKTDKSHTID